jgi:hypothetical protein
VTKLCQLPQLLKTDEIKLMRCFAKEPDYLPDDNKIKNRLRRLQNAGTIATQLVFQVKEYPRRSDGANLLRGRWTVTHDVKFIHRDGSVRNFRVYRRPTPKDGDIITLPVDGQLTEARVSTRTERPDLAQANDAEAIEI